MGCSHEMVEYIGITDRFMYCKKCDKKQADIDKEPNNISYDDLTTSREGRADNKRVGFSSYESFLKASIGPLKYSDFYKNEFTASEKKPEIENREKLEASRDCRATYSFSILKST
jgi:hypothetical protein